uniref:Uncharacterized protein n=1 Tax=Glossina pallidipes TaxID=7398 RepID=A0A1B0AB21_GLOPL
MGKSRKNIRAQKGLRKSQKNKIINKTAFVRLVPLQIQYRNLIKKYENELNYIESVLKKLASNDVTLNEGDVNLISSIESWDSSDDEPINKIVEENKRKSFADMKNKVEEAKSNLSNIKNDAVSKNRNEIVTRRKLFSPEELPSTSHSTNNKVIYKTQAKRSCGQEFPRKLIEAAKKRKGEQSFGRNLTTSTTSKPPLIVNLCKDDSNEMMELSSNMSQTSKKSVHKLPDVNAVKILNQTIWSVDDVAPHCSIATARGTRSLPNLFLDKGNMRKSMELPSVHHTSLPEGRFRKLIMNKSGTCKQLRFVDGNFPNLIAKATKATPAVVTDSTPNENQQPLTFLESNFSQQPTISGRNGDSKSRRAGVYKPQPFETVDL